MSEERLGRTAATRGVAGANERAGLRPARLFRQSLALLLSSLLVLQPMLANAQSVSASTTAPAANQPGVGTAPNGVPLIDIVTPNSKGLSHNKYDSFNVGTPGLILNNFKGEVGNSNLGGVTPGNPNLNSSGPASVILNEVISGNRSALNGAIEVFGGRADVVIANPNGITCDGCGFINTPHATLTTGVPDIGADGTLKGFTVNGGDVTIGTNGGNFAAGPGAVDLFDIVSRSVHVNGAVFGKDLRVTAGRNQFDYATGNATPLAATSGTPEYAIDGSALGAMQADRIKIVVTERGAGVRMRGDMAANAGELSLSADGKISVGNVSGQQGVSISSKAKVTASKVTSKAKVAVQADQGITLDTVAADDDILLSSGSGLLSVGGEVNSAANVEMTSAAGIAADSVMAGQTLTLSATSGDIQIAGAAKSGDALAITATSGSIAAASLVSGNNLTLSAGADIAVSGDVLAEGDVTASGRSIAAATIASGVDLAATAQSANAALVLQPAGDISLAATNGSITVSNALSSGDLSANASQNLAYTKLQSLGSADLSAAGQISYGNPTSAKRNLTLTTTTIDLSNGGAGNIAAGGTLTLNADSANLSNNSLTLGGLTLNLSDAADLSGTRINAVTNAGGSGDIAINAGGLSTSAGTALLAAHDLTLTLPSLTNAGQLAAGDDLTLNISGNFTNSATGLAYAGHDAGLFIGGVLTNNQGAILAGNDLEIAGTTSGLRNTEVTNISGLIQAGNDMSILTANLTNRRAVTPQWTSGTLVSSGVVSGFTLNPVAAGLPFGYLETADQNMYQLYAGVDPGLWQDYQPLLWSKATLADGTTYRAWTWISADGPEKVEPIIEWIRARVPRDANGNPVVDPNNPSRYFIVDEVNFSGSDESTTYSWDWSSHLSQSVYEDRLVGTLSPEATIRATRNLTIDATNLTNAYSSIEAGGGATLRGSTLTNTGVSLFRTTTTTCHAQGACTAYNANGTANPSKNIANGSTIVSSVQAIGGVSANIKAGGVLSVDFGSVNNTSAAGSMAGGASVTPASNPGDPLSALSGLTAGGALFNVNSGLGSAALAPPTNPDSGGFGGKIAHQTFLFETRAAYLDVGTFYGSGYFMDKIGYQPETTVPFLGDAYFENQLIDTQLRQLVGEGLGRSTFIAGGNAIEQMKTLLDNGATYANDHGLAVGQGLTPEQAAALTESIVLYQWQTVNGVQVLAPVVYVAAADRQKLSGAGAAMAGGSVNMNVGNLDNSGLIASAGGLTVSGSSIQGSGTFLSRGDTALNATNGITLAAQTMTIGGQNVVNTNAGVTAGGNLQLAGGGDLALTGVKVNATGNASLTGKNVTLDAAKVDNSGQQNATGTQIASGGALTIKATDNVNVIGSSAKAGTMLDVTADNGSVAVVATDVARDNQSGYTRTLSTDQQQSQLSAGTNATVKAGDDILLSGSSVKAEGNVALSAGDDINITAAQEHSASTFGKKSASSITHVGSEISAGGDLSVTAGNSSGDHDLNIVGSKLTADGKVGLKADGEVTIAEATDTATLDTKLSIKGGFLGSSEKTTTHLETTTAVGSAITGGGGVDIESGKDTVISASKIEAGNESGTADLNITAGGYLVIASGKDTSAKDDKGSRSGFLSKGSSSYKSYDETTVASELGASGDINLSAGGAAVIAGSKADADGSISVVGDSISVIGAAEQHALEITRKESGLFVGSGDGFISLWGKEQKSGKQASELNMASVLSAGTDVALKSRETDVNILGSQIYANDNITLDAARDVNITPGAESASSAEKEKRSGFGIAFSSGNGGASIGIGYGSATDNTAQSSSTNAVSTLSAGRDVTITAGRDANLQAAQTEAGRDVNVLAARDINLLSAQDVSNYTEMHKQLFAGVSLNVSSGLISAGQGIASAVSDLGGANGNYALAPAILAGYQTYNALTGINTDALKNMQGLTDWAGLQKSGLGSVSLTVGFNVSKSEQSASTGVPVVTSIGAGRSVTVAAQSGDITGRGVQIAAGSPEYPQNGDVFLSAGGNIDLRSAEATSSSSSSSQSTSAAIGVDLASGGLTGNASYGKGTEQASGVTQINSHVIGSGNVTIVSGGDTTLAGAVISGNRVTTVVGGDLNIISRQDTATYAENTLSAGIGFTPKSGLSGGVQKGRTEGDYANVGEQSGIIAGSGGYHVTVGDNVDLVGGVVGSTADPANNNLTARSLTWSNIENRSEASTSSYGVGLTPSGIPVPVVGQPAQEGDHGVARATLSPGQLTLTNQTQDLAGLNTDLSKANNTVEPFDIDRLKARQASAAAVSALLNIAVGDLSTRLGFAEGSSEKIALHAAVGALVSQIAGGNIGTGALAGAVSEIANGVLQDVLKANPNLTEDQKSAITQWVAAIVGVAVGGETGVATALDNINYNFLTHKQRDDLAKELGDCASAADPASCKAIVSEKYSELDFNQDRQLDACRTRQCVQDLLGDLNGDPRFEYLDVVKLQELGVSEALAQRLLSNQVMERWLTADATQFELKLMDVLAGVGYCEDNGQSNGCFATGQALHYASSTVVELAYLATGLRIDAAAREATGAKTGTVWDDILPTAGDLPNTKIPATFKLKAGEMEFYVNSNATKHMPEYLKNNSNITNDQVLLQSFSAAVKEISSAGSVEYGKLYNLNGWEIIFSKRPTDLLPVIKHALYK
ncbi:filamentous hemagglutinin N-terminal domain-containing protein [Rhizobium leguminosarum]|uniref:hemagglutinin repeat-containing protein n=1 Tax=Rhizobium leguminosarum TaxID=384 RepID=UPI0013C2611D|nr:hemagglutinin repeat-containing protein [Rhizobium leguminosarum]NEH54834.1 filamentous hemagglutinin N-terminal domain-containing protein [Rhizobium leguminosarum]